MGSGQPSNAASLAAASQGRAVVASYSRNGLNSPQPASPWMSTPSRTSSPRKRVVSGIEYTTRSGIPGQPLQRDAVWLPVRQQRKGSGQHEPLRPPRALREARAQTGQLVGVLAAELVEVAGENRHDDLA